MANWRLTPPDNNTHEPMAVNGRTYSCNVGSTVDVPEFDAKVLIANGWINTAGPNAQVGTTALRPTAPKVGERYLDTTVGAVVTWTGSGWTHSVTGGKV
jgi:hypothetical protein